MVQFRVRAQSLGEVAANLQTVISVFDANVAEVNSKVTGVVGASWQGEDAEFFQQGWTAWNESAVLVRTALTALSAQLQAAEGSYTTLEAGLVSASGQKRQSDRTAVDNVSFLQDRVESGQELADSQEQRTLVGGTAAFAASGPRGSGEKQVGVASQPLVRPAADQGGAADV